MKKTIWKIKVEKKKNCILLQNVRRITRSVASLLFSECARILHISSKQIQREEKN